MNIKELYYEVDTRKHQQKVCDLLSICCGHLLYRANHHDESKLEELERSHYINPVWELNTKKVPFGSEEYTRLTGLMGAGWKHHKEVNDHHWPIEHMNLFSMLEMVCDWIAAAERRGNDPSLALDHFQCGEEVRRLLRNTLKQMGKKEWLFRCPERTERKEK